MCSLLEIMSLMWETTIAHCVKVAKDDTHM